MSTRHVDLGGTGPLIFAMGIAQIISWGSLYYTIGVISASLRSELGFNHFLIFGAFSFGLLFSGALAPKIGAQIDREGGRRVMALGSILSSLALVLLGSAQGYTLYFVGSIVAGLAMSMSHYEAAFATLHRVMPSRYRRSLTSLTLIAGFASTVFWPLTEELMGHFGWRSTLFIYASLHLLVNLPIHLLLIPMAQPREPLLKPNPDEIPSQPNELIPSAPLPTAQVQSLPELSKRAFWMACAFGSGAFVATIISSFAIEALIARGFNRRQAVLIAAFLGPMHFVGRVLEMRFGSNWSSAKLGRYAYLALLLAIILLNTAPALLLFGFLFVFLYGPANGVMTIVRGTVPVELFGSNGVGALLGRFARPTFAAKALAPGIFSGALTLGFGYQASLRCLAGFSLFAVFAFWRATGDSSETLSVFDSFEQLNPSDSGPHA